MKKIILSSLALLFLGLAQSLAQCTTGSAPSYSSGCTGQYFTAITASGSGVTSTVGYSASSCSGSYYDYSASQGVTAATGSTVNFNITRYSTYFAYLAIYVDWNNNGTYETTELVGTTMALSSSTMSATYSFTIPLTGIVTNTNLQMRVFLGEPPSSGGALSTISPPCSARWGMSVDYYLNATCSTPAITIAPTSPVICGTGSVTLSGSGAGSTPTYEWTPATALSATTGTTVSANPTATTSYTVTGYGPGVCPASNSVTVTVNPGITPVITPSGSTTFCSGGSVTLSETSGSGAFYQWYIGATPITGATNSNYIASPTTTTTYTVRVTSSGGCTGSASTTVTVLTAPVAVITPSSTITFCNGNSVILTETSGTGTTYQWYNGATPITGATNNSYTAAPTATTVYAVRITNASGCTNAASITVTVLPVPTASVSPTGPVTICAPATVLLSGPAGYTYRWFNTSGAITGAVSQFYVTNTTGNYSLEVTNTSGCKDTSAPVSVTVNSRPTATATATGALTFCSYDSITITAVSGYSYQWLNGTTVISGATNASYTTHTPGTYDYRVIVSNSLGCGDTTASGLFHVVVNPAPSSHISASGSLTFCIGGSVTLSVPSAGGNSYQWFYGTTVGSATPISGATTAVYTATVSGYYYASVATAAGCTSNSASTAAHVNVIPNPVITHVAPLSFCQGGNVLLSLNIGNPTGTVYQWKRNSINITGATTSTYTANASGAYTCFVNIAGGCVGTTPTVAVTANAIPLPPLTLSGGVLKTSTSYIAYQWYRNAAPIPGATSYQITITDTASYSVVVTDINGCTSLMRTYSQYMGVNEMAAAPLPVIYPNPATNKVFVQYAKNLRTVISSMDGKTLIENPSSEETDISTLPTGLYIIALYEENGNRVLVEKLVKQ